MKSTPKSQQQRAREAFDAIHSRDTVSTDLLLSALLLAASACLSGPSLRHEMAELSRNAIADCSKLPVVHDSPGMLATYSLVDHIARLSSSTANEPSGEGNEDWKIILDLLREVQEKWQSRT